MPQQQYLKTRDAASYCSIAKSTLDKYRLTGSGPIFSKLGRSVVYSISDLDEWITSYKRTSTSDHGGVAND